MKAGYPEASRLLGLNPAEELINMQTPGFNSQQFWFLLGTTSHILLSNPSNYDASDQQTVSGATLDWKLEECLYVWIPIH